MSKKIMVIAGSKWQIPITKKIEQMGYHAYVVNLYEDSPAFDYATKAGVMDILDKEKCLLFAQENNVDAVISEECDIAMPTVAYIADNMNISSQGSKNISLFTNKFEMREFCEKHNLAYPEYKKCKNLGEALEFFEALNKKIIIKPLDANSSRGVYTINTKEELVAFFDKAMAYSKVEKCVLAERYIEGTEFTIDGIKTPEKHFTMAISEKKHYTHNKNIAKELYFSHYNPNFDYDELMRVNDIFVNESGLPFGLTHAEYKYEDGKFYLIEIAARGGGNLISAEIVPIMTGIDNYKYLIECSLGNVHNENFKINDKFRNRCCVLKFLDISGSGVVKEITGCNVFENNPQILKWELNFKEGDYLEKAQDDSKRAGYYIAYAESRAELDELIEQIEKSFSVVFN